MTINDIRNKFIEQKQSGKKYLELIGATFIADEPAIFGTINQEYINAEIIWYYSQSTNVNDIKYRSVPKAWLSVANEQGEINSNYGRLIFSPLYHSQYAHVVHELQTNPDSRRAIMIYTRPSIWKEYRSMNKNDFICTNTVQYFVRDNKLITYVNMRSNDAIFGYKNDFAWQRHISQSVCNDLIDVQLGDIIWSVGSLHIYENHLHLVQE